MTSARRVRDSTLRFASSLESNAAGAGLPSVRRTHTGGSGFPRAGGLDRGRPSRWVWPTGRMEPTQPERRLLTRDSSTASETCAAQRLIGLTGGPMRGPSTNMRRRTSADAPTSGHPLAETARYGLQMERTNPCSRSASSRPARPSTTSTRQRCGSTWCRASAAASRTTTSGRARRAGGGSASAARELGLGGEVGADELRRVLDGLDPRDGSELRTSSSRARVAGFDLTFSAPKSVSVLFGLGDEELRVARSRGARRRGSRGGRAPGAVGGGGAARARRCDRRGGVWARRGGVPASDVARRRSAAAHARPGREPRARRRRAVVGARWPAAVRGGAGGELHLPGGAAGRADADARRRVDAGAAWDRRGRRRAAGGAARRSAGGARRSRRRWPSAGRPGRGRPRRRRWRLGGRRTRASTPRRSSASGGRARRSSGSGGRSSSGSSAARGRATSTSADWEAVGERLAGPERADAARGDVRARRGAAGAVRGAAARRARGRADAGGGGGSRSSRRMPCRCCRTARRGRRARRSGGATGG